MHVQAVLAVFYKLQAYLQLQQIREQHPTGVYLGHVRCCLHRRIPQVTQLVCTACGKPCRTDAEKALHTKYTGHTEFVDKVHLACRPGGA